MNLSTPKYLLALLLFPLCMAGCIREDLTDCPAGLEIYFTYDPATYARTGVNEAEVEKVDVFAFDAQGLFQGVWTDNNPQLSPGYHITIPDLAPGEYRFVAWCGLRGHYKSDPAVFTAGQTAFNEACLFLEQNGEVAGGVQPLFHAQKTGYIHSRGGQTVYLPLVQAYNTINLTTEGLPHNGDTYRMTINDNNGRYTFDYSFAACGDFQYTAPCTKAGEGQLSASLNILKIDAGRQPVFEIYNQTQGRTLYRAGLVELINRISGIDYNTVHTFDIHIRLTTDMKAIVEINGWQVTEESVILY